MSSLNKEKYINVNKRSALFLKPVKSHHQFSALTVCLCRRCSAVSQRVSRLTEAAAENNYQETDLELVFFFFPSSSCV